MKYLAFLFVFYFTLLASLPCHDSEDKGGSMFQTSIHKSQSSKDQHGQENCSPFCTCSCCSSARHLTATITTGIFTKSITREYPGYGKPAIQDQPIKIWQPPQIA